MWPVYINEQKKLQEIFMPLMQQKKIDSNKNCILWWIAILSLTLSLTAYILLDEAAKTDFIVEKQRLFYLFIGFIVSGLCIICKSFKNWYKS